jgi:tetratricopeptide (TPR) repeat protein/TolB-like protein
MRMVVNRSVFAFKSLLGIILIVVATAVGGEADDRMVVMPFENRSQLAEYNWIRESFSIVLFEMIEHSSMRVLGINERDLAYERLRLNPNDLLTRASMIRVAETARANLALIGEFDVGVEKDGVTVSVSARLIETSEGRLVANKVFNFSGPLANLQQIEGQLAWSILYLRYPSTVETREQFQQQLTIVPPLAWQSFVKAVQTIDQSRRESYLRRAIQEYVTGGGTGQYGAAIYELGLLTYRRGDDAEAARQFRLLRPEDGDYESGLFHLGLACYRLGEFQQMVVALTDLSRRRPALEVLNNLAVGYLAKGEVASALPLLQRVVANGPEETLYRFNFAYALWRNGQFEEAVPHLRVVHQQLPQDGELLFLLARSLAATGKEDESRRFDEGARRYLPGYAKWTVDPAAIPGLGRLRHELDLTVKSSGDLGVRNDLTGQIRQRLDGARRHLAGNDESAAQLELDRLEQLDPGNAEAAYLRALIHQRHGETDEALGLLRTAVGRDPRLFEAHLLLGRLYLARQDRARASAHANQALAIDPASREAAALKQRIELGR